MVADLHLQLAALAVLEQPAVADGDDLARRRLVLGGVGQDDAAGGLRFVPRARPPRGRPAAAA